MAGDWIKMRSDLLTHPKVIRISSALKVDRLRTIGALFAAWCLFDAHSEDGTLPGYTEAVLNEMVGLKGFAGAMHDVRWLEFMPDGLAMPEFEEHNGKSAKVRAEDSKRKRIERTNVQEKPDKPRTDSGLIPDQRREEKSNTSTPTVFVESVPDADEPEDGGKGLPKCPHNRLLHLWSKHLPHLTQPRSWEGARRVAMRNRWLQAAKPSDYSPKGYGDEASGIAWWESFFGYIANDTRLAAGWPNGATHWQPDLEWVCNAANFQKIIDGKYNK